MCESKTKLKMQTVTSVSGGKTSAYLAANFPSDHNVFALVRVEDKKCLFPDKKIRLVVEDRIQKPFIGTAEDDMIIYTMLDLEQFLGKKIDWVSGITFEKVIKEKGGWLPNKLHRYCTSYLKIEPIFYWWAHKIGAPVHMQIGYRANEKERARAKKMLLRCNQKGLIEHKATFEKHTEGRHKGLNKWVQVEWQSPVFPLIDSNVYKDNIVEWWKGKNVRFAELNNCVHCFNRNPMLLKLQSIKHPNKMKWASSQEGGKKGFWRSDLSYKKIMNHSLQSSIEFDDFAECDSGYCGM